MYVSDNFKKTYCDEVFLLYEDDKMMMFTTKSNLSVVKKYKHWFADGTIKVSHQLSSIYIANYCLSRCVLMSSISYLDLHTLVTTTIIPLVYSLLIGKSTNDYNAFLEIILQENDFRMFYTKV